MKLNIKVKTNAREEKIEQIGADSFKISVVEAPEKGQANQATISLLSDYFDVAKSKVKIIRGHGSNYKVVDIAE